MKMEDPIMLQELMIQNAAEVHILLDTSNNEGRNERDNLLLKAVSNIEESQKTISQLLSKKANKSDFEKIEKWQKDIENANTNTVTIIIKKIKINNIR